MDFFQLASAKAARTEQDGAASSEPVKPSRALPWVEKYRPKTIDDISAQEEIVKSLSNAIKSGMIPHLLFYGPPGTGKTSTILAVARDLYGSELMKTRVMELNASDERGIAVVREKVKQFAMGSVGTSAQAAPFKLIILDEADSLTNDAQAALRRTIETYSRVTRFCIICNYVSRIIEPLASRCSKYRFKPLDKCSMMSRLRTICNAESVTADDQTLKAVLSVSGGDMRKAITFLQSAATLYEGVVTPENVIEISGIFPDKDATTTMGIMKTGTYDSVRRQAQTVIQSGYGVNGVLEKICDLVIADPDVLPAGKATICEKLAITDKRLVDGADEETQLLDAFESIHRVLQGLRIASDAERLIQQ